MPKRRCLIWQYSLVKQKQFPPFIYFNTLRSIYFYQLIFVKITFAPSVACV